MRIAFTCHVIYDVGDRTEEPTMKEVFAGIKKGTVDLDMIELWAVEPTIIITNKK